jgi:hypothetical protein
MRYEVSMEETHESDDGMEEVTSRFAITLFADSESEARQKAEEQHPHSLFIGAWPGT